jgi:GNAT superfamily N-acetyltransferase
MVESDVDFFFECLDELRGEASYSVDEFVQYLEANALIGHHDFRLLVGVSGKESVGILTCNRLAMPRYIGFGYEIEEVVIHPKYQQRGFGEALITAFLDWVAEDTDVRKVVVKTDDEVRAGKIYSRYFEMVEMNVYSRMISWI